MIKVARGNRHLPSRHLYIYLSITYGTFNNKLRKSRIEEL